MLGWLEAPFMRMSRRKVETFVFFDLVVDRMPLWERRALALSLRKRSTIMGNRNVK